MAAAADVVTSTDVSPWKWVFLSGVIGLLLLLLWSALTQDPQNLGNTLPGPLRTFEEAKLLFSDPFYDKGSNDKGIGTYALYSIVRVLVGFGAGTIVAVILGVILGLNPVIFKAANPFIQIFKAVSPIAWMPLFMYTVKDSLLVALLVVFMASLWPTMANTAFGVAGIKKDFISVARIMELPWFTRLFRVILPGAGPTIVAGLRISYGAAWVAVVPAEALLGTLGLGYFIWNEWNGLNLASLIVAVVVIGLIGLILEQGFNKLAGWLAYTE
jgi:nitrate/nitrite transport system permease protein